MRCVATQKIGPPSSARVPQKVRKYSTHFGVLYPRCVKQPVVAHADAEHPAGVIENECGEHRAGIHVEEGRHGADVKPGHGDCGNPVQACLMFAAVEKHRGRH